MFILKYFNTDNKVRPEQAVILPFFITQKLTIHVQDKVHNQRA